MPAPLAARIRIVIAVACAAVLLALTLAPAHRVAAAPQPGLFDDPRIVAWSKAFLAGGRDQVLGEVERDLRSGSPHPFSPRIWSAIHDAKGDLREAWEAVSDPALKAALASDPEIFMLYNDGEYKRLLEKYPPSRAGEVRSIWALDSLVWAAINEKREDDAVEYTRLEARIRSDHYQLAWNLVVSIMPRESARAKVVELIKPGGEWAGTPLGRYLAIELASMPTDVDEDEKVLAALDEWLRERPSDTAAMRRKAFVSRALGRSEEATALFRRANEVYPFRARYPEFTVALIVAGKADEARMDLERLIGPHSKDADVAARLVAFQIATGLNSAGQHGAAIQTVEKALSTWPEDAKLLDLRAGLALDDNSLAEAIAFSKKAVELGPKHLAYHERYLEILRRSSYVAEGVAHFTELEKARFQKSEDFYHEGIQLYTALGERSRAERIDVCRRTVAEYPGSAWAHQQLADALATAGQTKEALEELEAAFTIRYPTDWAIKRYAQLIGESGNPQHTLAALDGLIARYPWLDELAKLPPVATPAARPAVLEPKPASTAPRLVTQLGHSTSVAAVAASPDGRFFATGGADNTARVWEANSGLEILRLESTTSSVDAVAFTPDGLRILTGGSDGVLRVWSLASGAVETQIPVGARILAVAVSPDGSSVLVGSLAPSARLFGLEDAKEIRQFSAHHGSITSVTFSADGRLALTGSSDRTAAVSIVASGVKIQSFEGHTDVVNSVAVTPDNRFVLTGSGDKTARLWDTRTGVQLRSLSDGSRAIRAVAISADRRHAVLAAERGALGVWDTDTGKLVRSMAGHDRDVTAVAIVVGGAQLLSGSADRTARLWDLATGAEVRRFEGRSGVVEAIAFSPDGKLFASAGSDPVAYVWSAEFGRELHRLKGHEGAINAVAFSSDGRLIATGSADHTARVWDAVTGVQIRSFGKHAADVMSVTFSPDAKYLLTASRYGYIDLWSVETGKRIREVVGNDDWVNTAVFSPDGKYLLAAGVDRTARLWATETGEIVRTFKGHSTHIWSVAYSPDGRLVATGSMDGTARLWDPATGMEVAKLQESGTVTTVAFTPDGKLLLTGSSNEAHLWDIASSTIARTLSGGSKNVDVARFSHDGRFLVTSGMNRVNRLWDVATGRDLRAFEAPPKRGFPVAFTPSAAALVIGNRDGVLEVVGTGSGDTLCRLISFRDGTWAAVDDQGRYDAAFAGDVEGLHWLVGLEPIALTQLRERYYEPGLISKVFEFSKEQRRDVSQLSSVALFPEVAVVPPARGSTLLTVTVTNRGGGIGPVQVYVNDKEVAADARGAGFDPRAPKATLTVDLAGSSYQPGDENAIRVVAFNAEGYLSSRGTRRLWSPDGAAETSPPELYAIVGGISNYASPDLKLNFAAKDAQDIATALEIGAKTLFGTEKVHLTLLTTAEDPRAVEPTKANFKAAFEKMKAAKPGDVLVVYLAGHGIALKRGSDIYCYLTREANTSDSTKLAADSALLDQTTITNEELAEWMNQIKANKQVLILDTCAAGAAAEKIWVKREVTSDQIRAIQRLKERTGVHILMGSAADAPSYEASQYGQGLLTYALLEGIAGAALREEVFVDVAMLFNRAVERVPLLAKNIGGIQQPLVAARKGSSFDIGRIEGDAKARIPVARVKPVIIRPLLINVDEGTDSLRLSAALRKRLREASYSVARGPSTGAPHIYIDEEEFPDAIRPSGTYTVDGDKVSIRLVLTRGQQKLATVQVEGSVSDLSATLERILAAIEAEAASR
jgi:WD40 repeat protein/tetratricopeptide (TPR) repeat protein